MLTLEPEFGLEETIGFRTLITEMESGLERRRAKWTYGLRTYRMKLFAYTESAMNTLWDFYIARKGAYDTFIVKIPAEYIVTGEAIGTGDAVATEFMLDEFPVDTTGGTFTMYVDGSEVGTATLHNNFGGELSYVAFVSAPGNNLAVTGDYEFCFRVRFAEDNLTRQLLAYQLLSAGILLREVRWITYRPRRGNTNIIKGSVSDSISIAEFASNLGIGDEYDSITITDSLTMNHSCRFVAEAETITITESITGLLPVLNVSVNDSLSIAKSAAPAAPA